MAALAHLRLRSFSASRSNFKKWGLRSWRSAKSLITLKSQSRIRRGKSIISSLEHSWNIEQFRNQRLDRFHINWYLVTKNHFNSFISMWITWTWNKKLLKNVVPKRPCRIRSIRHERGHIWNRRIPLSASCTNSAYGTVRSRNSMFRCSCCKSRIWIRTFWNLEQLKLKQSMKEALNVSDQFRWGLIIINQLYLSIESYLMGCDCNGLSFNFFPFIINLILYWFFQISLRTLSDSLVLLKFKVSFWILMDFEGWLLIPCDEDPLLLGKMKCSGIRQLRAGLRGTPVRLRSACGHMDL